MIPRSGHRFLEKIMLEAATEHDPKKRSPVLGKDHAQTNSLERDDDSKENHLALCGRLTSVGSASRGPAMLMTAPTTTHAPLIEVKDVRHLYHKGSTPDLVVLDGVEMTLCESE